MYRTILIGNYIAIQGKFVRELANGYVVVRAGSTEYSGPPVIGNAA
ncbi:MAG: hypothetical protein JJU40_10310 [Rhodobacteraceae bacterium]|nr:hypothetical protein [Paracoccaceae bacterium]